MGKALVLLQLSVLLVACFTTVSGNAAQGVVFLAQSPSPFHHSPVYPPSESPKHPNSHPPHQHHQHHHHNKIQPPSHPPVHPPTQSPVHPPTQYSHVHPPTQPLPKRYLVAVQGVVFCKPCNYSGVDTLLGATPLAGASVKLECNNTKKPLVEEGRTDKNGYFYIMGPKSITTFGSHKCKVSLSSSPTTACNRPTNLHKGIQGAILMPEKVQPPVQAPLSPLPPHDPPMFPYELFTVGPFAFEPETKCPR